jgi:hypothetical protein
MIEVEKLARQEGEGHVSAHVGSVEHIGNRRHVLRQRRKALPRDALCSLDRSG